MLKIRKNVNSYCQLVKAFCLFVKKIRKMAVARLAQPVNNLGKDFLDMVNFQLWSEANLQIFVSFFVTSASARHQAGYRFESSVNTAS